jgi:hypothetical protein
MSSPTFWAVAGPVIALAGLAMAAQDEERAGLLAKRLGLTVELAG